MGPRPAESGGHAGRAAGCPARARPRSPPGSPEPDPDRRRSAGPWEPPSSSANSSSQLLGVQVQLVLDGLQQLVPGHLELRDALVLQDLNHVVVADAERLE